MEKEIKEFVLDKAKNWANENFCRKKRIEYNEFHGAPDECASVYPFGKMVPLGVHFSSLNEENEMSLWAGVSYEKKMLFETYVPVANGDLDKAWSTIEEQLDEAGLFNE